MHITASSALFLIATCAYLGIRIYFKRRMAGVTRVVSNKSSPGDLALVGLVVCGQIVLPLLAIFSPWLNWAQYPGDMPAFLVLGAFFMVAGLWLFWRSHADLGDNWSVTLEVQAHHQLVTHGVYRLMRHPMYASFFVLALGQWLLLPNGIAGPSAFVAVAVLYWVRKPNEEAMLLEQFGDDYRKYMDSTGGILPKFDLRAA